MDFRFSVVMAAYNSGAYIKQALDSLINQSLDFKENIQVIIVNDASEDNTSSICQGYLEKYPDNIVLINNNVNCGPAHTRNIGLHYAEGEIINFLDSDDYISKKTFERVDIFFDDFVHVDIASIPIKFFGAKRGDHPLNYKFKGTGVINLLESPQSIQLSSASAFFRADIIKGSLFNHMPSRFNESISTVFNDGSAVDNSSIPMVFNERLSVSEDALLINQLLLRNPLLGILSNCTYHYRKKASENTSLISDSANHKSYYTTRVDNYMIRLLNDSLGLYGKVPQFIQHVIMYDLQWIMEIRQVDHLLSLDELTRLYDKIIAILFYIGDKVIIKQRSIPSILKTHILLIKYFKWDYLDEKTFNFKQIDEKYYSYAYNLIPHIGKNELSFIIQELELNKVYLDIVEVRNIESKINFNDDNSNSSIGLVEKGLSLDNSSIGFVEKGLSLDNSSIGLVEKGLSLDNSSIGLVEKDLSLDNGANINSSLGSTENRKELYISGMITSFYNKDFDIYAVVTLSDKGSSDIIEHEIKAKKINYPQRTNLSLNFNFGFNHNFEVSVPIDENTSRVSFRTSFNSLNGVCADLSIENPKSDSFENINHHDMIFSGDLLIDYNHTSRLSRISNYMLSKNHLIIDNGNNIVISDRTAYKHLKLELVTLMSILTDRQEGWRTGLLLRVLYYILYPFYRNKRIWIFMDLPYTADDNGLQLFKSVNEMDKLSLEEYNELLALDEGLISSHRYPYKYELFEGKDIRFIGLIKDLLSSIRNIRKSRYEEENSKVKFIKNGSLGLDSSQSNGETEDSFDDYLNEYLGLDDRSEDSLNDKDYLKLKDLRINLENMDNDLNNGKTQIHSKFDEYLEFSSDFRKKAYSKFGFLKDFDRKLDSKYHNFLIGMEKSFDSKYENIKSNVKGSNIKDKILLRDDDEENFKNNFNYYDAIYYFDLSKTLSENKLAYLLKYMRYRFSKFFLRRRMVKAIDNRKIKKFFALEQSTSHFNNIRHMENQYIASSTSDKVKKLLGREKQSGEYKSIKKYGKILAYKSLKHRIYALYAEAIISSHPDNNLIYPFYGNFPHLAGLVKAKTVFLQHGVTKDDVSYWLNKFDKNLDMIVSVSDLEKDSFLRRHSGEEYLPSFYGYDEDTVKVLGFPRFDYLEALDDKKEILIMPTWRRQLHNLKSEDFVQTNFYKTFNTLINDNVLLDFLDSKGYKLVFKPHPNLNKFINLFNKDSRVEFDLNDLNYNENNKDGSKYASRRYADIFNHSSLVVTDFSSVSFDFAYIKKPLIYYHYDNDYHFDSENAYFNYESMGFGPVVESHNELIVTILDYVKNGCIMEDAYKKRVDSFFKYIDKDNSRRVYKAILEMDKNY